VIFIPILAAVIGAFLAIALRVTPLKGIEGQYLAVACIAGLDTVFGGVRSGLEGKFNPLVFLSGFFSNTAIAFCLAWLGDKIYVNLFLAVTLVLGARIFTNLSLIRRFLLTRWQDSIERNRLQAIAQSNLAQSNSAPELNT
jgi:small basic protein